MSPFIQPVGPAVILPPTVLGVFRLFFTTALMATIVEEANRYTRQVLGDAADGKWVDVDADEMWAFLGFVLHMGINKLPQMHRPSVSLSPHSRAYPQGPLLRHLEVFPFHQQPTNTFCSIRVIFRVIVFPTRFHTSR